jgi:hypothetical protein
MSESVGLDKYPNLSTLTTLTRSRTPANREGTNIAGEESRNRRGAGQLRQAVTGEPSYCYAQACHTWNRSGGR